MTRVTGAAMIAGMDPVRHPGTWVFATCPEDRPDLAASALATMREGEGLSLIVPHEVSPDGLPMAWIELRVNSALDGVGLTAAVSTILAESGIACNVVAGHHHDHLFVPEEVAAEALVLLRARAAEEQE
ncbi:ACT domain-containing protein [Jannaschia sp.]|nr:ACT domain-containing protein [Jannaschia sp.]